MVEPVEFFVKRQSGLPQHLSAFAVSDADEA